jgi:hypothetical protein
MEEVRKTIGGNGRDLKLTHFKTPRPAPPCKTPSSTAHFDNSFLLPQQLIQALLSEQSRAGAPTAPPLSYPAFNYQHPRPPDDASATAKAQPKAQAAAFEV